MTLTLNNDNTLVIADQILVDLQAAIYTGVTLTLTDAAGTATVINLVPGDITAGTYTTTALDNSLFVIELLSNTAEYAQDCILTDGDLLCEVALRVQTLQKSSQKAAIDLVGALKYLQSVHECEADCSIAVSVYNSLKSKANNDCDC